MTEPVVLGELLVGQTSYRGSGAPFRAFDPGRQQELDPQFHGATLADVELACALAEAAFDPFRATAPDTRAGFLEQIAGNLELIAEQLVPRVMAETGLPEPRVRNELGRTTGQLRMFARTVRDGSYLDARIDPALSERTPPRPDLRLVHQPLGPVAVFGASNFPLAFSVAGGDTASALAAGCPVVVKAHHAHPGTSELVGRVIQQAVAQCDLPEGVFSLLFGNGQQIGAALVTDPRIRAVGFTGSRGGGTALMALAQQRRQPIPVYAEMSSINPVILLPGALAQRGEAIGQAFAAALTLGAGQFCTNPGLVLAVKGAALAQFAAGACAGLGVIQPATMLTPTIHAAYRRGVEALGAHPATSPVFSSPSAAGLVSAPGFYTVSAASFSADPALAEEVFGAASLLVECDDLTQLIAVLRGLEGQLTVSVHAGEGDAPLAASLMPVVEQLAGRILFNGFGTGVEVCDAMVHGGPYPSTSDGRSTSVGSLAIMRFLRPVCYQDVPDDLLPAALRRDNPLGLPRRVDGARSAS